MLEGNQSEGSVSRAEEEKQPKEKDHETEMEKIRRRKERYQKKYMMEKSIGSALKKKLKAKWEKIQKKEKEEVERVRAKVKEAFIKDPLTESHLTVIMPKYYRDTTMGIDREELIPPSKLYLALGWDEHKDHKRKHYRMFYNDELENVEEVLPNKSPFISETLLRGQTRAAPKSWFSMPRKDESGQDSTLEEVGVFKGIIQVQNDKETNEFKDDQYKLTRELIKKINAYSKDMLGAPTIQEEFDVKDLASADERAKFEKKMRLLKIDHLSISRHLCDLNRDAILR